MPKEIIGGPVRAKAPWRGTALSPCHPALTFLAYISVQQAEMFHKSQTQVINDLVHEKLAVGV
jgi:hypothetical protein